MNRTHRPRRAFAAAGAPARRLAASLLLGLSVAWGGAAFAQAPAAPLWQAEVGFGHDSLSGGRQSWRQIDVALRTKPAPIVNGEIRARRTERFGLSDSEIAAEGLWTVAPRWRLGAEAAVSPTHRVLARHQLAGSLEHDWGGGWLSSVKLRRQSYATGDATGATLGLDRYFGSAEIGEWRFALRLMHNRLKPSAGAAETGGGASASLDRYFGDGGRVGLIVADAEEMESNGSTVGVDRVRSLVLVGRWPVTRTVALVGDVGRHRIGTLYRRTGARLGVQLDF